jgi:hypothetical protein
MFLPVVLLAAGCGGGDLTLPGPGDPSELRKVAGDEQEGLPGETLTDPLVVELVDGLGRPVPGAHVAFRFTDELPDAEVDPATAATDEEGRALAHARLGTQEGSQGIEAFVVVPGEDLRVRFSLTARAEDDGGNDNPDDGDGGDGGDGGGHGGKGKGGKG